MLLVQDRSLDLLTSSPTRYTIPTTPSDLISSIVSIVSPFMIIIWFSLPCRLIESSKEKLDELVDHPVSFLILLHDVIKENIGFKFIVIWIDDSKLFLGNPSGGLIMIHPEIFQNEMIGVLGHDSALVKL